MGDEVFVCGQQLGYGVLVLPQDMLNEHAGVVNEHICIPLVNLFRTPSVVVLEDRSRPMKTEECSKNRPMRQVLPVPVSRRVARPAFAVRVGPRPLWFLASLCKASRMKG